MVRLTFNQSKSELMVRAAATILFRALDRQGAQEVSISELAQHPQYGFTASAALAPVGPKLVRITDLQDGKIVWESVPYCECAEPEKYLLRENDILFARTGATTGKTHLVRSPEAAVFASYLIRLRPKPEIDPGYLYAFFQSDDYWSQISEEKGGSAQPNVNGDKLSSLKIPRVRLELQHAIAEFVGCVRRRQDGDSIELPKLPEPLTEQWRIVARIEELAAKIEEARGLREEAMEETERLMAATEREIWDDQALHDARPLEALTLFLARGKQSEQGESEHFLIKTQHVQQGRYIPTLMRLAAYVAVKVRPEALARNGDILIACSAAGCLGRVARYEGNGGTVSTDTHVAIARPNPNAIDPDYLYAYLKGSQGQHQLRSRERGDWQREKIGFRLTELNVNDLRAVPVPVPSLVEQRRIVAYLDELQVKVDKVKKAQVETSAELGALMPSILDKAFRGELLPVEDLARATEA